MKIAETVGFKLAKILRLKRCLANLEMKELGLSTTQWRVLLWLKVLGPCSQKELLTNLDIDAGHLTRVLDEFEKNNYIIRTPLKEDRRALFIQTTKRCQQKYIPRLEEILQQENAILIAGLTQQEQKSLLRVLEKITTNIEAALKITPQEKLHEK